MEDTWFARDLPVLEATVRLKEEDPTMVPTSKELAEATGLERADVKRALKALADAYLEAGSELSGDYTVKRIYPEARRAVGPDGGVMGAGTRGKEPLGAVSSSCSPVGKAVPQWVGQ